METQLSGTSAGIIYFILFILLATLLRFLRSSKFKGWTGEKKSAFDMWVALDAKLYQRFHDVIIPSKNGTSQIDHLLVSQYGVFIVETKNVTGWIFGSEDQKKWTKSMYGKNYSFQNPIHQTYRQKKHLAKFLNINESVIFTVVFFVGDCKFKTRMPSNVVKANVGRYIRKFKTPILSSDSIHQIVDRLEQYISKSTVTTRDHVRSLQTRHNSTTVCPRCGADLVERMVKNGSRAGSKFLGCTSYPKCKFTKNA